MLDPAAELVTARFLEHYLEDQSRGEVRTLEEYLALFPGFDVEIARAYAELRDEEEGPLPRDPRMPERVGSFQIESELGRGGQATVYLARQEGLGRPVALKILRGLVHSEQVDRFHRESRIASRLEHRHICRVYQAGEEHGMPYLAMEFVEGRSLARCIREGRRRQDGYALQVPGVAPGRGKGWITEAIALVEKVARALHEAHGAGIVHRDLNPNNVLVREDGEPVIVDFGLARSNQAEEPLLSRSGDVFGTVHYMSPEQISGEDREDPRIDVWSLGVTLYEALTGERPFQGATEADTIDKIRRVEFEDPRRHSTELSRDIRVCLATALSPERSRRYESAEAFAEDLRRLRERRPIAARPLPIGLRALRWMQRNPAIASAIALVLLTTTAGMVIALVLLADARQARSEATEQSRQSRAHAAEAAFKAGELEQQRGYWDEAKLRYEEARRLSDEREELPEILLAEARLSFSQYDFEAASAKVDQLEELALHAQLRDRLALLKLDIEFFHGEGRTRPGTEDYEALLQGKRLLPAEHHYVAGLCADSLAEAEHEFRTALRFDPGQIVSLIQLPAVQLFLGKLKAFDATRREFERRYPRHPQTALLRAFAVLARTEKSDESAPESKDGAVDPRFAKIARQLRRVRCLRFEMGQWVPSGLQLAGLLLAAKRLESTVRTAFENSSARFDAGIHPLIVRAYRRYGQLLLSRIGGSYYPEQIQEVEGLYELVPDEVFLTDALINGAAPKSPNEARAHMEKIVVQLGRMQEKWSPLQMFLQRPTDWQRWVVGLRLHGMRTLHVSLKAWRNEDITRATRESLRAEVRRALRIEKLSSNEYRFLWQQLAHGDSPDLALAVAIQWLAEHEEDPLGRLHLAYAHFALRRPEAARGALAPLLKGRLRGVLAERAQALDAALLSWTPDKGAPPRLWQ